MMPNTVVLHPCSSGDAERDFYLVRLGSGIAAMRERRRMTRKALASRLGISTNRLGFWERGGYRPPGDKLLKLLLVLEVSAAELLAAGDKALTRLRRHDGPEDSERRRSMSNETSSTVPSVEPDPGVVLIEPDLKSERLQEESVSPEPGPVQAG